MGFPATLKAPWSASRARIDHLDTSVIPPFVTTATGGRLGATMGQFGTKFMAAELAPDRPKGVCAYPRYYSEKKFSCLDAQFIGVQAS